MFLISAALFFAISCTDFPDETQIGNPTGPNVEITILEDFNEMAVVYVDKSVVPWKETPAIFKPNADSVICFNLKTSNVAAYFSYLVTEGVDPDEITPYNVLRCSYPGVKGSIQYGDNDAEKNSANDIVLVVADNRYLPEDLEIVSAGNDTILLFTSIKFTTYQIFAASAHKDGIVGNMSYQTVVKSDGNVRSLSSTHSDGVISIKFSEKIVRPKESTGKIFGTYFTDNPTIDEVATIQIEEENIDVYDDILEITLSDKFPAGSHVCITWEADAVRDLFDNHTAAYTSKQYVAPNWQGRYGRMPFKLWEFDEPEEELIKFHNATSFRIELSGEPSELYHSVDDFDVSLHYILYVGNVGNPDITMPLLRQLSQISNGVVSLRLSNTSTLIRNMLIGITIGEGSYVDKWGNGNEEFVLKDQYQFVTTYTITASVDGENGSISNAGARERNAGQDHPYNMTPSAGYQIDKVMVDGVDSTADVTIVSDVGTYTFYNLSADHSIVVSFKSK